MFEEILSYILGRSIPLGAHAIRHEEIPTKAHRRLSGSKQTIGLPANSSSCNLNKISLALNSFPNQNKLTLQSCL